MNQPQPNPTQVIAQTLLSAIEAQAAGSMDRLLAELAKQTHARVAAEQKIAAQAARIAKLEAACKEVEAEMVEICDEASNDKKRFLDQLAENEAALHEAAELEKRFAALAAENDKLAADVLDLTSQLTASKASASRWTENAHRDRVAREAAEARVQELEAELAEAG